MGNIQFLALLTTLLVFGPLGYLAARRLRRPVRAWIIVIIIIATLVANYVGVSVRLISIFGFTIYLNWVLYSFGQGMIFNLLVRKNLPAAR